MKKSNLANLKLQFDKVHLRHIRPDNQTGTTIAILVKDKKGFVGISRCHVGDQFNREIGRNISFGRAISVFEGAFVKTTDSTRFVIDDVADLSSEDLMTMVEQEFQEKVDAV